MVDNLQKTLKKSLSNVKDQEITDDDYGGTYLFFSFDLVNSTAFKNKNKKWGNVFDGFIKQSKLSMTDEFPYIKIWKMVGDELLFYMKVNDVSDLHFAPKKTYKVLKDCIKFIEKNEGVKSYLSIKATIWTAVVYDSDEKDTEKYKNIIIKEIDVNDYILDFLGTDIDEGFRISKFVIGGILAVDAKLACFIANIESEKNNDNISDFMRIVSYQQLKGIWDNRHYPIVWYMDNWDKVNDTFVYDEKYNNDIVKQICDTKESDLHKVPFLKKILSDLNKLDTVKDLEDGIKPQIITNKGDPK